MNRKIKLFILGSVLLNLLLIGVLIGQFSKHFGPRKAFREPPELSQLSEPKQQLFREAMDKARQQSDALRQQQRELKKEANRLLSAEPFDKQAYLAKMEEATALQVKRKQVFAETTAEIAGQFTPQEREILGKILRRPPPRRDSDASPPPPGGE